MTHLFFCLVAPFSFRKHVANETQYGPNYLVPGTSSSRVVGCRGDFYAGVPFHLQLSSGDVAVWSHTREFDIDERPGLGIIGDE